MAGFVVIIVVTNVSGILNKARLTSGTQPGSSGFTLAPNDTALHINLTPSHLRWAICVI